MSLLPSESPEVSETLADFHRAELDAVERVTGRDFLTEAIAICEGHSRLLFERRHGWALCLYADRLVAALEERDTVVADLMLRLSHQSEEMRH